MASEALRLETVARLRQAVAAEAYDEAQTALADYRLQVETALIAWPSNTPLPVELAREADELLRWALQVVRCARARTSGQLDQIWAALGYRDPAPMVRTWKLDG